MKFFILFTAAIVEDQRQSWFIDKHGLTYWWEHQAEAEDYASDNWFSRRARKLLAGESQDGTNTFLKDL